MTVYPFVTWCLWLFYEQQNISHICSIFNDKYVNYVWWQIEYSFAFYISNVCLFVRLSFVCLFSVSFNCTYSMGIFFLVSCWCCYLNFAWIDFRLGDCFVFLHVFLSLFVCFHFLVYKIHMHTLREREKHIHTNNATHIRSWSQWRRTQSTTILKERSFLFLFLANNSSCSNVLFTESQFSDYFWILCDKKNNKKQQRRI